MSEITGFIDLYCERTVQGFFNEPLNAVSNLGFVVAGWWAARQLSRTESLSIIWVLCVLAALIGLGSFVFHTVPSRLTQWLDVIPIWAFVLSYAMVVTHMATGKRWLVTLGYLVLGIGLLVVLFVLSGELISAAPPGAEERVLNGSLQYLPVVLVLLLFSVGATVMKHRINRHLWWATGLFAVALFFRTIDIAVCQTLPTGTHFIWHLFDALLIAVLLHGLIRFYTASHESIEP